MTIIVLIIAIIMTFLAVNIIRNKINSETMVKVKSETEEKKYITDKEENEKKWLIEIPAISLVAEISEGTDKETLNNYVGHFEITPKKEGNVGLAAHNRGYQVNYFENLKKLEGGEEIIYTCEEFTKTYEVIKNIKISDEDWSHLENSNQNKLTLITCIANEPQSRRCVQATEKEEN